MQVTLRGFGVVAALLAGYAFALPADVADTENSSGSAATVDVADSSSSSPAAGFDAASLVSTTWGGRRYGCKCYIGQSCWPSNAQWRNLNASVDGTLLVHIPPGAPCHSTFNGPLGTVNTYNAAACANVQAQFASESWT